MTGNSSPLLELLGDGVFHTNEGLVERSLREMKVLEDQQRPAVRFLADLVQATLDPRVAR